MTYHIFQVLLTLPEQLDKNESSHIHTFGFGMCLTLGKLVTGDKSEGYDGFHSGEG